MKPVKTILSELKHHIPFTLIATLIAVILIAIIYQKNILISESFFHIIHPLHLFVSATVSAAIFYKYKNNFIQALLIGISASIIIGSLSDVIFPYLGGALLNFGTYFYLPLFEEPILIFSVAILGSIIGIETKFTKIPHFVHVLLSVFAGLFYLVFFSASLNLINFIEIFLIVFVTVLIPCCISDIVFPLLFVEKNENKKKL